MWTVTCRRKEWGWSNQRAESKSKMVLAMEFTVAESDFSVIE